MRIFRQLSAYSAALLLFGTGLHSQPAPGLTVDIRRQLDDILATERERLKIPAVGVAIALNGRVEYVKTLGLADIEQGVPADDETRFRTASLAKPLTATAVMQLVERGAIDLDAPIQRYCPAFPEKQWPVTPRLVLGHLAGIRHYTKGESTGTQHYFTIADSLALFNNDPLRHQPGTKYEYSTFGFSVLGCAIEGASKTSFAEYLETNVFRRAGMTHSTIDDVYQIVPKRARGYLLLTQADFKTLPPAAQAIARPDSIYNAPLHDTSMKLPGGGLISTPTDYARFALALLDGSLVKKTTLEAMWTSQKTTDGTDTEYGFGFGVVVRNGQMNATHSGNQAGASSLVRISPGRGAAIVIMTNLEGATLSSMANAMVTVLLRSSGG